MKKILLVVLGFLVFLFVAKVDSHAITFDLIAPSGQLQRGQEIKFTINVDTEGKSYGSTRIGMTHDTQVLEYVSASAGNTFTTISADPQGTGKLVISGNSTSGYSGSGVFAYVTFKLIATSAGSTQLCTLFNPTDATPTPAPSVPVPTALPTSGNAGGLQRSLVLGFVFLALAGSGFFVFKKL